MTDGSRTSEVVQGRCPCCESEQEHEVVGSSPHIETGEPVDQVECQNCLAVTDRGVIVDG